MAHTKKPTFEDAVNDDWKKRAFAQDEANTERDKVPQSATEGDEAPRSATERDKGPLEKHHIRVHKEDWAQLEKLAGAEGISASTKLRMILREWLRTP